MKIVKKQNFFYFSDNSVYRYSKELFLNYSINPLRMALPILRSWPCLVMGMPVARAIFCLAPVMPIARFQENERLFY